MSGVLAITSQLAHDDMALMKSSRKEIVFTVESDEESGWYVAHWDAPRGKGGITTQGKDLGDLQANVREAVECHFENGAMPKHIRLRFLSDPVLATA